MKTEKGKYGRLMTILSKSVPVLESSNEIEEAVMKRISLNKSKGLFSADILDFLFGWVYIKWVRSSLIAASCILLGAFVWQQSNLQKQIDYLNYQITKNNRESSYDPSEILRIKQVMYKLSEEGFGSGSIIISEKELGQILDSITDLRVKYRDIMEVINEDQSLRRKIGKKLNSKSWDN